MENASAVRYGCIVRLYSRVAARNAPYRRAFCLNSYKKHGPCGLCFVVSADRKCERKRVTTVTSYVIILSRYTYIMSTRRIILKRTERTTSDKRMPPHNKT